MCYRVPLVRNNVSEEGLSDSFHLDNGGDTFLRNVGSYKSHTASHPRRRYSSTVTAVKPQILQSINFWTL
jgi:hypothetical protein